MRPRRGTHRLLRHGLLVGCILAWTTAFVMTHLPSDKVPRLGAGDVTLHGAGYFGLGGVFWLTLASYGVSRARRATLVICILIVYAAVDEYTQSVPVIGRSGSMTDWVADVVGATAAVLVGELTAAARRALQRRKPAGRGA
ncbi:MAG: VanZ family protein [Planctomycetota bacterium]